MKTDEASNQWELAAPGWAKWEDVISSAVVSATNMMFDMAGVVKGKHVLDLASGAGSQTIMAAQRVGPSGHVVANDISKTMLHHVHQNASAANLSNISTLLGAVQELEISPSSFDAVICRFALMLFAEPAIVLANVHQALKPNGKIGVAVFSARMVKNFIHGSFQSSNDAIC